VERSSPLSVDAIQRALTTRYLGRRIELRDRVDSTNREGVALGQADVEHGTLVLADAQTAGRGRLGRHWFSPPGRNIYASIVVRRPVDGDRLSQWLSWLPLMAAVSVAEAIDTVAGTNISVKWPNDLLIDGRKVGGILCESGTSARSGSFQVVGIGININGMSSDFPHDVRETATTIRQETGRHIDRNRLLAHLLKELEFCMEDYLSRGVERIALAYQRRSATLGKTVKAVLADGSEFIGLAREIGSDGSLTVVRRPSGERPPSELRLRAADIMHLR
jgi:BirA family biotin operon repressor/biotin-[acetyl-CoA-carboxylase] ligase